MSETKAEIRKKFIRIRNDLPFRREKDCKITEKVVELLSGKFHSLFVYVSFGSEVDTHMLIRELFGKAEIYVPHTEGGVMRPVPLDSVERLDRVGAFGNVYTSAEAAAFSTAADPEVTVVPMLAFDRSRARLGYGGGCYDRFLAASRTFSVGLAYDEQRTDKLPTESTDIRPDLIVTPSETIGR